MIELFFIGKKLSVCRFEISGSPGDHQAELIAEHLKRQMINLGYRQSGRLKYKIYRAINSILFPGMKKVQLEIIKEK